MANWFTNLFRQDPDEQDLRIATDAIHRTRRYLADPGWQLKELEAGMTGDCDSFALTLAYHLMRIYRWPRLRILAIVAYNHWQGGEHAVLQVQTARGNVYYADPVFNKVTTSLPAKIDATIPPELWDLVREVYTHKKVSTHA